MKSTNRSFSHAFEAIERLKVNNGGCWAGVFQVISYTGCQEGVKSSLLSGILIIL